MGGPVTGCIQPYSSCRGMAANRDVAGRLCQKVMLGPRGEAVGTHHGDGEGVDSGQFGEPPAKKDGWMYLRGWFGADFSPNSACFWAVFFGLSNQCS